MWGLQKHTVASNVSSLDRMITEGKLPILPEKEEEQVVNAVWNSAWLRYFQMPIRLMELGRTYIKYLFLFRRRAHSPAKDRPTGYLSRSFLERIGDVSLRQHDQLENYRAVALKHDILALFHARLSKCFKDLKIVSAREALNVSESRSSVREARRARAGRPVKQKRMRALLN